MLTTAKIAKYAKKTDQNHSLDVHPSHILAFSLAYIELSATSC